MKKHLYEALMEKPYPIHQYMDEESLKWLKDNLKIKCTKLDFVKLIRNYPKFPVNKLEINKEYFCEHSFLSIHGIRHQMRVCIYIWLLVNYFKVDISNEDFIDLLQASVYHDIKRENDNEDYLHGYKSSLWIFEHYPHISKDIINSISNHDKNITDYTIYDKLIKTADALDRYRLPKEKWWIKEEYFLFEINNEFLDFIKFLMIYIEKRTYSLNEYNDFINEVNKCLKTLEII